MFRDLYLIDVFLIVVNDKKKKTIFQYYKHKQSTEMSFSIHISLISLEEDFDIDILGHIAKAGLG